MAVKIKLIIVFHPNYYQSHILLYILCKDIIIPLLNCEEHLRRHLIKTVKYITSWGDQQLKQDSLTFISQSPVSLESPQSWANQEG